MDAAGLWRPLSGASRLRSRAIGKAATARRPRHRYHPGTGARLLLGLHAILPARWWDALMRLVLTSL